MRKIVLRILLVLGGIFAFLLILLIVGAFLLNTPSFQNKLIHRSTQLLAEQLGTDVSVDSVSVDFVSQYIKLRDVIVEDLQDREMLHLEELDVKIAFLPLLRHSIKVSSAKISGLRAELYKPSDDEPANYQFLIDAFKKNPDGDSEEPDTTTGRKESTPMELDIKKLRLERISLKYNDSEISFDELKFDKGLLGGYSGTLAGVKASFKRQTKKGEQDCQAGIEKLKYEERRQTHVFYIEGLHFANDNHLPRKNTNKPHRGAFDDGHLNVLANARLSVEILGKDSIAVNVGHFDATDEQSGIMLQELRMNVNASKRYAHLSEVTIQLPNTQLNIESADLQLPNKKLDVPLRYSTSPINGRVLLKDISKPFAPVLSKFMLPLNLSVVLRGDAESMEFSNVNVSTDDRKLRIAAKGGLGNLSDKYKLAIRFHVNNMIAKDGVAERVINLFPVKKFMMKQLQAMGDIVYSGDFAVLYRQEKFSGHLASAVGNLNFHFTLDENNKYIFGSASTSNIDLAKAFDMKDLGPIVASADFRFDISKPRTAAMRKEKGGKLPIGSIKATVDEARYKKLKVKNLIADIVSDGAVATGNITIKGRHTDILCSFNFTSTDSIKSKIKVKPGIRFHGLSDEDRMEKQQKKQEKAEAAKALRQQKAEEKAARQQQRLEEKTLRDQQRSEEKALRKQAKAQEKARKKEEKAARKARNTNQQ